MLLYIWKMYLEINVRLISRIKNIKEEIEHCKLIYIVIYIGNLDEKVLKLRMPTITKEQLKDYE